MSRIASRISIAVAVLATVWLLAGTTLSLMPAPKLTHPQAKPASKTVEARHCHDAGFHCFAMRDGALLASRELPSQSDLVVVFLHGVLSSSGQHLETSKMLHDATGATIVSLDLRGHGLSSGARGDIAHIGQYEEDVADVVSNLRREHPHARIVLSGHSMGGGIVARYALLDGAPPVDGYLLFAPHLGEKSPTTFKKRQEPQPAATGESPIKLSLSRTIGIAMLNKAGIHLFDGRDTLFFDMPFPLPVSAYTFRAMVTMSPENYESALKADSRPMLILAGDHDEAFAGSEYPAVARLHHNAQAFVIPNVSHDGIAVSPEAMEHVKVWASSLSSL